ncbi:MAG: hemolysin family protein [Caulobacteraceae bacterium]
MSADDHAPRTNGARRRPRAPSWLANFLGLGGGDDHEQSADVSQAAADMLDQAEAFQNLRVSDVMTPRADIVAIELSAPFAEVVAQFAESEHSRMPVYRESLDDPVGVVHIKDVFKLLAGRGKMKPPTPDETVLRRLRREVLFVPASMRAADLMVRMQARRIHLALVIDEFGGTDGLVTLEDLIEAVVGEIDDEHDEAAPCVTASPGGVFEADARAPLEDLEQAVGMELSPPDLDEEIDTVGGLVSAVAGRVPQRGEVIAHPKGFDFEVVDADPRRVKRVRIRPTAKPAYKSGGEAQA